MRALPGPTPTPKATGRDRGSAVGGGWEPQPRAWLFPVVLVVLLLGGAGIIDAATAALVKVTGTGEATHYLPVAAGFVVAAVAAVWVGVVVVTRRSAVAYPPPPGEAAAAGGWVPEPVAQRPVAVVTEVLDLPRELPGPGAAPAYPMPDLVVDVEGAA